MGVSNGHDIALADLDGDGDLGAFVAKLATQIYEKLLYAYPGDFRDHYAAGMERM